MPPTLETADGRPVDVTPADAAAKTNRDFEAAMNGMPVNESAPPKRAPQAEPAEEPKPKRGRPPKAEQARVAEAPAPEATPAATARRAEAIAENVAIIGGVLTMAGTASGMKALKADGYFLTHAATSLGTAAAEVARHEPGFAKWLDKSGGGGKAVAYMALFGCVSSLGAQLAVNHGILKPGLMGTAAPEEIIRAFETEAQAAEDPAAVADGPTENQGDTHA
jgi:hypothetical protein